MTRLRTILLLLCVATVGCFFATLTKLSPDDVLWTPQTDYGRDFKSRLVDDLRGIATGLQDSCGYQLYKEGISLRYDPEKESTYSLWVSLAVPTTFNTLQTTYQTRAASVFASNLFRVSKVIVGHSRILAEKNVVGFQIGMRWRAANFLRDEYRLLGEAAQEGMLARIPKSALKDFSELKISIQELGRKSEFLSTLGKTELDFTNPP